MSATASLKYMLAATFLPHAPKLDMTGPGKAQTNDTASTKPFERCECGGEARPAHGSLKLFTPGAILLRPRKPAPCAAWFRSVEASPCLGEDDLLPVRHTLPTRPLSLSDFLPRGETEEEGARVRVCPAWRRGRGVPAVDPE